MRGNIITMIRITQNGLVQPSEPEILELQQEFKEKRCIVIPQLVEEKLLENILQGIAKGEFFENNHDQIKNGLYTLEDTLKSKNIATHLIHFIINNKEFFKLIQEITGCREIKGFKGRIYKLEPGGQHKLDWHEDTFDPVRVLAISINLGANPYEGGVFQIKRKNSDEVLREVPCGNLGDAHIFDISNNLLHRVTATTGKHPRVAAAGWFTDEISNSGFHN